MLDIRKVAEGLRTLFSEIHGDPDLDVVDVEDIAPSWEARIVGFRLTKGKDSTEMAARIYHGEGVEKVAEREFNVMNSLTKIGYPVADVYICYSEREPLGAPFIIMEKLPRGSLLDAFMGKPEDQGKVLAVFSRLYSDLHRLPPRKALPLKRSYRSTQGRLTSLLSGYENILRREGFTGLLPVLSWLKAHQKGVTNFPLVVVHGDFHPGNVLLRRDGSPAVIDWTSADIGDYREDLAWTKMLASTILAPELGELLVSGYSTAAGRKIADLDYFEVLEILRRLTDFSVNMKRNGGIVEARGESSGIKLDQRQHYRNVLDCLKTLAGLDVPEIRRLLG